jgi:hypothetical protein
MSSTKLKTLLFVDKCGTVKELAVKSLTEDALYKRANTVQPEGFMAQMSWEVGAEKYTVYGKSSGSVNAINQYAFPPLQHRSIQPLLYGHCLFVATSATPLSDTFFDNIISLTALKWEIINNTLHGRSDMNDNTMFTEGPAPSGSAIASIEQSTSVNEVTTGGCFASTAEEKDIEHEMHSENKKKKQPRAEKKAGSPPIEINVGNDSTVIAELVDTEYSPVPVPDMDEVPSKPKTIVKPKQSKGAKSKDGVSTGPSKSQTTKTESEVAGVEKKKKPAAKKKPTAPTPAYCSADTEQELVYDNYV